MPSPISVAMNSAALDGDSSADLSGPSVDANCSEKEAGRLGSIAWGGTGAGACGLATGKPAPCALAASCLPFHHCLDIWASISSIFLSVTARPSGSVARLFWKTEGRPMPTTAETPRLRSLRNWSNSRLRMKSFWRLRSIICLSTCLSKLLSSSACGRSNSDQSLVGLRTNIAILDKSPGESLLVAMAQFTEQASTSRCDPL